MMSFLQISPFKGLPDEFRAALEKNDFTMEELTTDEMIFRKLDSRRLHAVLTNKDLGLYTLKQLNLNAGIHPIEKPITTLNTYLVFSKLSGLDGLIKKT